MRALVTGAKGFIGKNLSCYLAQHEIEVLSFCRGDSKQDLERLLDKADVIYHLAGVNRSKEEKDFFQINRDLTENITDYLMSQGKSTPVVYSSSIQAGQESPYGESKRQAENIILGYSQKACANVYIFRLSNVFGKWCRPNYNSVVATFCHNSHNNLELQITNPHAEVRLVYIDDVVKAFHKVIVEECTGGYYDVHPQREITISALASLIEKFRLSRDSLTQNFDMSDTFIQNLYGTWLSYLPPEKISIEAVMHQDSRGYFSELIKSPYSGQVSVSKTLPGITRGNHWHKSKAEKFIVVQGCARVSMRELGSSQIYHYDVCGDKIKIIDIPPGYTHCFKNTGTDELVTIIWAGEVFDPEDPDTYPMEV